MSLRGAEGWSYVQLACPLFGGQPYRAVVLRAARCRPPARTLSLYVQDQKVGEGRIRTQPGKFGLGGGGLIVGRSGAEPVGDG